MPPVSPVSLELFVMVLFVMLAVEPPSTTIAPA
jgi:hypothetical protein